MREGPLQIGSKLGWGEEQETSPDEHRSLHICVSLVQETLSDMREGMPLGVHLPFVGYSYSCMALR